MENQGEPTEKYPAGHGSCFQPGHRMYGIVATRWGSGKGKVATFRLKRQERKKRERQ